MSVNRFPISRKAMEGVQYRSMTQMIGETSIEALAAAEASAANRKPKLDVFHALSCFVDRGLALSL